MSSIWLTALPLPVTTRIASFISDGKQDLNLLHFAQTEVSLSQAAFEALSNKLTILSDPYEHCEWTRICPDTVDKLVFKSNRVSPGIANLLASTSIESADVTNGPHSHGPIFECLGACKSLRKLAVRIYDSDPEMELLWDCLAKLDLEVLVLECGFTHEYDADEHRRMCMFAARENHGTSYFSMSNSILKSSCPNLKILEVTPCALVQLSEKHWPVIHGLDKLEQIIVQGEDRDMPWRWTDQYPGKAYVRLWNVHKLDEALPLGEKLLSLCLHHCLERSHMAMLALCVNLEDLCTHIEEGCEANLAHALRGMESLRSLYLTWGRMDAAKYCKVEPGAVLEIARAACKVSKLGFGRVIVGLDEWEAILKTLGGGLETLRVWVAQQDESEMDRCEAIIFLVVRLCPRIRFLGLVVTDPIFSLISDRPERMKTAMVYYRKRCPYVSANAGATRRFVMSGYVCGPQRPIW